MWAKSGKGKGRRRRGSALLTAMCQRQFASEWICLHFPLWCLPPSHCLSSSLNISLSHALFMAWCHALVLCSLHPTSHHLRHLLLPPTKTSHYCLIADKSLKRSQPANNKKVTKIKWNDGQKPEKTGGESSDEGEWPKARRARGWQISLHTLEKSIW